MRLPLFIMLEASLLITKGLYCTGGCPSTGKVNHYFAHSVAA
jgi:hypothetical protein